jgi:2-polyprenyl-6-methoxyphenol hydroxylase-like FAD-dependent oxidoreductase
VSASSAAYDYEGYLVTHWPNGVQQRPAIVGSVIRTISHSGGESGTVAPAGAATALSLATVAPGLRVCLADTRRDHLFRVGESVPPLIQRFLDHLGLWQSFLDEGHCPSLRTLSAWGTPRLEGNEFFLHVYNTGWRLDRARFDRWLAAEAERRGAVPLIAKIHALTKDGEG